MQGMGRGASTTSRTVVAFRSSLSREGLVVLAMLLVVAFAWAVLRSQVRRRALEEVAGAVSVTDLRERPGGEGEEGEPSARRLLRWGFGLLWLFDGILQMQPAMPAGLADRVIRPAAAPAAEWVQRLVGFGVVLWDHHRVEAAVGTVWIQVGIGALLLVSPRGRWSRLAGLLSAGWGLVVWVFGEAFGGLFAPGLTWLFGAPGAGSFYLVAGLVLALPERVVSTRAIGRHILRAGGLFLCAMALLQAWPGRGFWRGRGLDGRRPGTLLAMVHAMAATPQPRLLASLVSSFGSLEAEHAFGVNLVAVALLGVLGGVLAVGPDRMARRAALVACAFCLTDWVLVEDMGFFGGLGTDPNSMVPMALLLLVGVVGTLQVPRCVVASAWSPEPRLGPVRRGGRERVRDSPGGALRLVGTLTALGIVLLGAVPMAVAAMGYFSL